METAPFQLNMETTALVVIDLQKGIVGLPCAPLSSADVVKNAAKLVDAFRAKESLVFLVRVATADGKDLLHPVTDQVPRVIQDRPADYSEIVPEIGVVGTDRVITKLQWGAFHGTEIDLQLRRRGITTLVLCGIATGYGVDTTAREAFQHGYNQVFAIDAMTGLSEVEHNYVRDYVFPRMGRIRTTEEILTAL